MQMLPSRLASHGLSPSRFQTPEEVIKHYGCIQAQDIGQANWVIGSRIKGSTADMVHRACMDGTIVRTWPMRGTLHYLDPQNVRWVLDLCASKTLSGFAKRREFLGISDTLAERALEIIDRELRGGKSLSRTHLTETLLSNGIPMQTQWTYHLACYAATRGLICFGPPEEKEDTFVLLDEWVKNPKILTKEAQLAELARMYFRGHSPATVDDLAWWCGLGKIECRKAIALIKNELETVEYRGITYYQFSISGISENNNSIQMIGGFDEYFLGYRDRSLVADREHHGKLFSNNGIFFPIILQSGKAIGTWKRTYKKDTIVFQIELLSGHDIDRTALEKECNRYTVFQGYNKFVVS